LPTFIRKNRRGKGRKKQIEENEILVR
jgi:hypothetical protein